MRDAAADAPPTSAADSASVEAPGAAESQRERAAAKTARERLGSDRERRELEHVER